VIACVLAIGCGHGQPAISNHAAPTPAEACSDHRSDVHAWMSLYASDDPNDTNVPYEAADVAWHAAAASFEPCYRGYTPPENPLRIGVKFKLGETGFAHDIETWGPDATVDRCVCETIKRIAFPRVHPRLAATLAVGP